MTVENLARYVEQKIKSDLPVGWELLRYRSSDGSFDVGNEKHNLVIHGENWGEVKKMITAITLKGIK